MTYAGIKIGNKVVPEPPEDYDKALLDFVKEEMTGHTRCTVCGWPRHELYVCTKCHIDEAEIEDVVTQVTGAMNG